MSEQCRECLNKEKRIKELENLVRRMAESADKLLKKGEETKEKVRTASSK
jgi:hypothetical protein